MWLSGGTMVTGHSHATGFIAAKSSLVQMSCSGTNGHTLVCSNIVSILPAFLFWSLLEKNSYFISVASFVLIFILFLQKLVIFCHIVVHKNIHLHFSQLFTACCRIWCCFHICAVESVYYTNNYS